MVDFSQLGIFHQVSTISILCLWWCGFPYYVQGFPSNDLKAICLSYIQIFFLTIGRNFSLSQNFMSYTSDFMYRYKFVVLHIFI